MRLTEEHAARLVFDDTDADAERVIGRLRRLVEFLLCPGADLTPEQLEFRIQLMADYRLASLLRIYAPDIWYWQWCYELREYVVSRWEESWIEKSWVQTRKKVQEEAPEKK